MGIDITCDELHAVCEAIRTARLTGGVTDVQALEARIAVLAHRGAAMTEGQLSAIGLAAINALRERQAKQHPKETTWPALSTSAISP